jgi:hypothetical protein
MEVLATISFLAFALFIIILIIKAIQKKPKKVMAIGLMVSLVLFFVGVNGMAPKTAEEAASSGENSNLQLQASIKWTAGNDYTLDITNTGLNTWYGFKIVVASDSDAFTNPLLSQDLAFPPGRLLQFTAGALVNADGKYIGSSGIWKPGKYTISMTARLTPNGKYQSIGLADGSSYIIEVTSHLRAAVQYPGGSTLMVVTNRGDDTWYGYKVAVTIGQSNYSNISVNRNVQVLPGQSITFLNGDLVDQFGIPLLSSTPIGSGVFPLPSMSAQTSLGGPFQELTLL